jgi:hypothetical protein
MPCLERLLLGAWLLGLVPLSHADTLLCADLSDPDQTRLVAELDHGVKRLNLVTPEFLWSDPLQPETRRFPAGKTDTSPNLAGRADVEVRVALDPSGLTRTVFIRSLDPNALELAGLRGELVIHDVWQSAHAVGSLFYSATGNIQVVVPVQCEHLSD